MTNISKLPVKQQYPEWLDVELWQEYVEYRIDLKQPLTARAERMAMKLLGKFIKEGGDQQLIVMRTIVSAKWTGLFQAKSEDDKPKSTREQLKDEFRKAN